MTRERCQLLPFLPRAQATSILRPPFQPGMSRIERYALLKDSHDSSCDPTPIIEKYPVELMELQDFVQHGVGLTHPDRADGC